MKTFASFMVACSVVSMAKAVLEISLDQKAKLDVIKVECKVESGADINLLKKMYDGEFPEDQKLKDFLFCVAKKIGFQNDAGELQEGLIVEKLGNAIKDPAKAKDLIDKCGKQEGSPAEITYKVVTCLYNSGPNHILIIH